MINFASIPQYFYSIGDPELTFIFNIILWGLFSALILEIGLNLHQKSKDIKNNDFQFAKSGNSLLIIGYVMIFICILFMIFFLLQVVSVQFFPNMILAVDAFDVDLSILFNLLMLYFMLNIIYRVGSRLIGRSTKLMSKNEPKKGEES